MSMGPFDEERLVWKAVGCLVLVGGMAVFGLAVWGIWEAVAQFPW